MILVNGLIVANSICILFAFLLPSGLIIGAKIAMSTQQKININDEKASLSFFNFFQANLFNDVLFIYLLCTLPFHSNDFVKDKTTIKTI